MNRRQFLTSGAIAAVAPAQSTNTPWYLRTYRWGQTNITEKDPVRYDIDWWRGHWKRTRTQAVIINAGGIVAYYPSKFPLHYRAEFLNDRDLYGELTAAAHKDGLVVMARMDSNRAAANFFEAHPDWFSRDSKGQPYRAVDKYIACIHSGYYEEYLPAVLREIVERSHPEGLTDNSWAGMGREAICYCPNCERSFARTGQKLPAKADWDDAAYRRWIEWSYRRRLDLWDLNNRTTQAAGGRDCIWSGMNSGSVTAQARSFRDLREICKRAHIVMLDHQRRDDDTGFQQNGDTGKRVHQVLGWDKLAPESMALYQSGPGYYRVASKPAPEARMWMIAGIAGGIQPWWHHIAAYHEDRRMYRTAEPVMRWHQENERYLVGRTPVASVGLVWSQRNTDFFGRDDAAERVDEPYAGWMHALVRARIPYLPVHIDDVETQGPAVGTLVLPNIGAMSEEQCAGVRRFVSLGGNLIVTGATSRYDEWGDPRPDFGLSSILGVHATAAAPRLQRAERGRVDRFSPEGHTYLRLHPEWRGRVDGPHIAGEPKAEGFRHPVLAGLDETDIVPYGGSLQPLQVDSGAEIPLTYVPPFPTYPPETSWMRQPVTDIPGLVLRQNGRSRVAYLPAGLDRRYAREHLPDHGNLLGNLARWACGNNVPVEVSGPGLLDCHLYRQPGRLILHIVNLTSANTRRAPVEELIPVGPVRVSAATAAKTARLLVAGGTRPVETRGGRTQIELASVLDHEVIVFE